MVGMDQGLGWMDFTLTLGHKLNYILHGLNQMATKTEDGVVKDLKKRVCRLSLLQILLVLHLLLLLLID